ncbi:hypothetical protein NC653_022336 [Populus alba x Populus x berolinensis]|uniref:Uncharacterized protein n=1 Tax=Populus alba x Populus x berolinensis TaxID=444605 RepID=A0AAD6MEX9_9ROSI|nr:hypothetical protein NC653_022336 [Populus alba x Populus x berolinensis]
MYSCFIPTLQHSFVICFLFTEIFFIYAELITEAGWCCQAVNSCCCVSLLYQMFTHNALVEKGMQLEILRSCSDTRCEPRENQWPKTGACCVTDLQLVTSFLGSFFFCDIKLLCQGKAAPFSSNFKLII